METGSATFWQSSFERHGSAVLAFLTSRLGRRDQAEDLLQETFVRVMRTPQPLRDAAKVRAYLFSTAHRLVLNLGRKRRPKLFAELQDDESSGVLEFRDPAAATEEIVELERLKGRLAEILERMPEAQARAFRGAVLEQKSYAEIAREQGWTVDQVRMNVYRGRQRAIAELRDLLRLREESR